LCLGNFPVGYRPQTRYRALGPADISGGGPSPNYVDTDGASPTSHTSYVNAQPQATRQHLTETLQVNHSQKPSRTQPSAAFSSLVTCTDKLVAFVILPPACSRPYQYPAPELTRPRSERPGHQHQPNTSEATSPAARHGTGGLLQRLLAYRPGWGSGRVSLSPRATKAFRIPRRRAGRRRKGIRGRGGPSSADSG